MTKDDVSLLFELEACSTEEPNDFNPPVVPCIATREVREDGWSLTARKPVSDFAWEVTTNKDGEVEYRSVRVFTPRSNNRRVG